MQRTAQWYMEKKTCDWRDDNKPHLLRWVPRDTQISVGKAPAASPCFWLGLLYIHRTKKISVLGVLTKILEGFSSWVELIYLSQWDKWALLLRKRKTTWGCYQHHKKGSALHSHSSDSSFSVKRCCFFNGIVLLEKWIFSSQSEFY